MQSYPNPQPSQVGAAPHRHPAHTGMAGLGVARPAVGAAVPPNAAQDMPTYSAQSLGQQQFYRDPQAPHQTAAPPGRYAPPATQPPAAQPPTTAQSGAGTVCPPTGYDTRPTTNYSPAATTQYQTGATGGYGPQAHSYPTMDPAGRTASQTRSGFQGSQRMAPPYAKLCAREPPKRSINLTDAPSPVSRIPFTNPPATVSTHQTDAPPLSTVGFISQDTGCCSPKFFRPTFGLAPVEARLVTDSCISFGAVLQPLCRPLYPQEEVPLITSRSPIRCHRCSGYLSCHAHFTEQGRCWLCPLCEVSNEVPQEYFCNLDSRGRRLDRMDKAELHLGAVEFDVEDQPDYLQRNDKSIAVPSQPLHTLFLIDISRHARVNFLTDYVAAMRLSIQAMAALPEAAGTRVGFITYATRLHFYNFRDPRRPQVSMADVDHPFVPLPFSAMCWLDVVEEYDLIDAFLCDVERLSADAEETDCAVGAAIEAAMIVLAGLNGGRVVVSAHRSPQTGIGAIKLREQHKTYGTDKGADLLRPMDGFWTTTATKAAQHSISFDLFMVCSEYCELATMSNLCHVTNGQCFLLSNYTTNRDAELLQSLMCARLTDETGYAGILRVRCSTGLRVARYRGHFYSQTATDMDLATVTGASTFFVDFAHEDKLDVNKYAFFQVALLYTTRAGRRRVRLLSYRLRCTRTLTEAYTASDLEATTAACIHDAMADTVNKGPHAASTAALKRMVKHLVNYRIFCIGKGSAQRHVLMPKHLQLLPLFIGCLCRSQAMVDGTVVRVDERAQSIFDWIRVPPHRALIRLHPMLYDLQNLLSDSKLGEIHDLTGKCVLPTPVRLLYDYVRSDGAYVLVDEETRTVFMWIGAVVPPNISTQLFGGPDATTVCRADGLQFDDFNPRVKNLLYAVVSQDEVKFRFAVIHQGDRREEDFFALLKCEAYGTMMGYGELLEKLYTQINNQIAESGYGY